MRRYRTIFAFDEGDLDLLDQEPISHTPVPNPILNRGQHSLRAAVRFVCLAWVQTVQAAWCRIREESNAPDA
jgi:hypothetical protein